MYESVKDSVAAYTSQKKKRETAQDKQVFKWKFVVIALGVALIVLIGGMSEILKEIANRKVNKYDTTFMFQLLRTSSFLTTTESVQNFLYGLNASEEIVFDSVRLLFETNTPNITGLVNSIEGRDNLLYFIRINDGLVDHRFGMFLQKAVPKVEQASAGFNVSESRNHKISSIYNFEQPSRLRLNNSDDCFLYKYEQNQKRLQLVELFQFGEGEKNGQLNVTVSKSRCFGLNEADAIDNVYLLTGLVAKSSTPTTVYLRRLQVYQLQMKREEIRA